MCNCCRLKYITNTHSFLYVSLYDNQQDELANQAKLEQEREQAAEAQRCRQIAEKRKAALQSQIFVVTASYRKTQAELNTLIVEVMFNFFYGYLHL